MELVSLALMASLAAAQAQDPGGGVGFDAHGFQVTALDADVRDPLTLHRPGRLRYGDWYVGGVFEYADEPLIRTAAGGRVVPFVDDLMAVNLSVGSTAHERVRFEASAPVYLASVGPDGQRGPRFGDARLGGMVLLVVPETGDEGFGLGFSPYLDLPTGDEEAFLGQASLAGSAVLSASGAFDRLTLTANSGMQFNPAMDIDNLTGSDAVLIGLGVGYSPSPSIGLNYEVRGSMPVQVSADAWTGAPFEGLLTGRYVDDGGGFFLAGAAMGLTPGIGAATLRLFLGGGFGSARPGEFDTDGDGITDDDDACPADPGDVDFDGCPTNVVLRVNTSLDGRIVGGAHFRLEGSVIHEAVSGGMAVPYDVPAESMWRGTATLGDCLSGDKIVKVGSDDLVMVIPLGFRPSAQLTVMVRDVNGEIVEGARVRFESADPYCEPPSVPPLDKDGRMLIDIGLGEHVIIIDAPGFRTHQEALSLDHNDEDEVFVLLAPG